MPGAWPNGRDLHGDDEKRLETGFHKVQNDGASTTFFGENLVNTVADGIYHLGFMIKDGHLLNEDGDRNAALSDVADWLNYFLSDASSTGTGLDRIVDVVKSDRGLARNTAAAEINEGAKAADAMNRIIVDLIGKTGASADGWITVEELTAMNHLIQGNTALLTQWTNLHGDDEGGQCQRLSLRSEQRCHDGFLWSQPGGHGGRRHLSPGFRDPRWPLPQRGW
jgi:hypothetical protein